jgi:hypothetical protein
MDMKQTLERVTPETERLPRWDAVLRDARPSPARWAVPRVAAVGAVLALAAFLAIAPWRGGERAGVLDRALAAVGDGPVTHLVLRTEWGGTLVNLETGKRTPLYGEKEYWFDPERGVAQINRFGDSVQYRHVARPENVEKPIGILASGYREALESGRARLAGRGVVDGIPVYWIQVRREVLPDVEDGQDHVWAQEVGVARDTYEPVYVRETRDGRPGPFTGARVLVAEQLPAGSGDFTPPPREPGPAISFGVSPDPISPEAARSILNGRAAWLGQSFKGLPLAKIGKLTMRSGYSRETGRWADEVTGVHLTYGSLTRLGEPDGRRPFVTVQQAPRRHIALERGIGEYEVPKGHIALTPGGHAFLYYEGTYVAIHAFSGQPSEELALAAARDLRPVGAGPNGVS